MITTNRFFLRPLVAADVSERYVQWFSDDIARRYITSAGENQSIETLRSYVSERENCEDVQFLGIFTALHHEHIGNIKFEPICTKTHTATMGILIGDPAWRGKGVAPEVLDACSDWLYLNRGIKHILLGVHRNNSAAITAYEKSDFKLLSEESSDTGVGLKMQRDYVSASRLALGTVQFGLNYGIASGGEKMSYEDAFSILNYAAESGIRTLDTAVGYGDSETRLGKMNVEQWRVISKLPKLPDDCKDVTSWVESSVCGSLERLGISSMDGLLLHRPQDLLSTHGKELYSAIECLKKQGLVSKIGISIYDPSELDKLVRNFEIDIVQAPFNIVDRRLQSSGWLKQLKKEGVEVHARSVFLQGLLLLSSAEQIEKFGRWEALWKSLEQWLMESKITSIQACLGFVLANSYIDKVLVGVDTVKQLKEIISGAEPLALDVPDLFSSDDTDLVNPSRWG
jgi:aryl-alcohol dehydrogenase-like predicted oxidoreductase/RimJ/RimL family protein N-acetyltransferase